MPMLNLSLAEMSWLSASSSSVACRDCLSNVESVQLKLNKNWSRAFGCLVGLLVRASVKRSGLEIYLSVLLCVGIRNLDF